MSVITHEIRTATGTYFLDETGRCHWAMSSSEQLRAELKASVGARFVACFDPRGSAFLERPSVGGYLLFAHGDERSDAFVLLRSAAIESIESHRGAALRRADPLAPLPQFELPPELLSPPAAALDDLETIDPDDLVAYEQEESTSTLPRRCDLERPPGIPFA